MQEGQANFFQPMVIVTANGIEVAKTYISDAIVWNKIMWMGNDRVRLFKTSNQENQFGLTVGVSIGSDCKPNYAICYMVSPVR